jgi:hypothetical protein
VATGRIPATALPVADLEEAVEVYYARGWTDGLPVVPPTEGRVRAMLAATTRDPEEVVGRVAPRWGKATVAKIAINAVMAGCRPEYLPVVLAAVEAVCDPAFNLQAVQGTADVVAPLLIVNGPIRRALDINCGPNVFGQGWRANATIGRALRLILMNLGGGLPGQIDKATFGHPGKYTYCVGEHEEASPWEPLHVERGLDPGAGAVTVFAAEAPHQISDHVNTGAAGILATVADSMATMGNCNMYRGGESLVVHSPTHAGMIAKDGFSKRDVKDFLFEHARRPLGHLKRGGEYVHESTRFWPRWVDRSRDDAPVPVATRPEDILVLVTGDTGGSFSLYLPGWGYPSCRAVTRRIAWRAS